MNVYSSFREVKWLLCLYLRSLAFGKFRVQSWIGAVLRKVTKKGLKITVII